MQGPVRTAPGFWDALRGTNARRELGYNPRSLKEGLTETLYHEMRLLGMRIPAVS